MPDLSAPDPSNPVAENLFQRAPALGRMTDRAAATAELVALCQGDRSALEQARDRYARRLHGHSEDWDATSALTVLNRALAAFGWTDHYGWKGRRKP
ncbi:MAG TPA: hypothetical protein VG184_10725 [Acidimicrobiales bacterium]|nr:hypothetical protein [Acidimicrobiales bacterium]